MLTKKKNHRNKEAKKKHCTSLLSQFAPSRNGLGVSGNPAALVGLKRGGLAPKGQSSCNGLTGSCLLLTNSRFGLLGLRKGDLSLGH